jgi:hypothetical protein
VATSCGGGATQCYSLSTRQADGAPVAVEEDAAAMAKLLRVSLVAKRVEIETLLQLNLWNLGLVWFYRDFSQVPFQ